MRLFIALCVALAAGGFGAWAGTFDETGLGNDPAFLAFAFLLFAAPAGAVTYLLGKVETRSHGRAMNDVNDSSNPNKDEHGVYRFFGDVFDRVNHPLPGAHDRFDSWGSR